MARLALQVGGRLCVTVMLAACGQATPSEAATTAKAIASPQSETPPPTADPPTEHRLVARVDPRIELMSMLFRAAKVVPYAADVSRTPYERAVDARLAKWASHPAVAASKTLHADKSISYNAPVGLAAYLQWPSLQPARPLQPLPPLLDDRWAAVDTDAYLTQVRSFAEDAELEAFFGEQAPYFQRVEAALSEFVASYRIVPWFEGFFGRTDIEHVLVQGLLVGSANYGASMQRLDGGIEAYQIVVVWKADAQGIPHPDGALLGYVVHEMAHSYVNPVTEERTAVLEPSGAALFARVRRKMEAAAYDGWQHMVNESLVRASTRLYLEHAGAADALTAMKTQDDNEGFAWVGELATALGEARTLAGDGFRYGEALPRAVEVFERWAKDDAAIATLNRFRGPINAVYERGPTVLVPTAAAGPTHALETAVRALHTKLGNAVVTTSSQETLTAGQSWVVYGSPSTNDHVEPLLDAMGVVVARDRLQVGDRHWEGEGLVLIAAYPRSGEEEHAVLVYTAHDDATLEGVNDLFHGPTDWVVGQRKGTGFAKLDEGMFPRGPDGTVQRLEP
ncbi:MAG: DUF4932 domain-containing protein [Myxococcota bacterium]